jgi:hypothetical protein
MNCCRNWKPAASLSNPDSAPTWLTSRVPSAGFLSAGHSSCLLTKTSGEHPSWNPTLQLRQTFLGLSSLKNELRGIE